MHEDDTCRKWRGGPIVYTRQVVMSFLECLSSEG